MKSNKTSFRVARSESFTEDEMTSIRNAVGLHKTTSAAAQSFMIDRTVLTNILLKSSAHPTTVKKVRKVLDKLKTTA